MEYVLSTGALTARGVATWDSLPHLDRSRWLVHMLTAFFVAYGCTRLRNARRTDRVR
jgi:hypothetical protein